MSRLTGDLEAIRMFIGFGFAVAQSGIDGDFRFHYDVYH